MSFYLEDALFDLNCFRFIYRASAQGNSRIVERFGHGTVHEYKCYYGVSLTFLKGFDAHLKMIEVQNMALSVLPSGVSQYLISSSTTSNSDSMKIESIKGLELFFHQCEAFPSPLNVTFGLVLEPKILTSTVTLDALSEITGNNGLKENLRYSFDRQLGLAKEDMALNATYLDIVPLTHPTQILRILSVSSSVSYAFI